MRNWIGIVVLAAMLLGCTSSSDEGVSASTEQLVLTQEEVALVLALVNAESTDLELLDDDVGLDSRAATNIIAHRDGADGVFPSADDDLFETIGELDDISYVGPTAIYKLRDYAVAQGSGDDGETVEGVVFSADEAAAVIWGVNQATMEELDIDVALTSTAASNLIAAAPYQSVAEMGDVSYVGPSALTKLRAYAPTWQALMEATSLGGTFDGVTFDDQEAVTALAIVNEATDQQLKDGGVTTTPRNIIIANRPWSDLAALAAFSGIGPSTMQALKGMVPTWTGPQAAPVTTSVQQLVDEANDNGTSSQLFDQLVAVSRAIVVSDVSVYSVGSSFFVADPNAGDSQQLKVFVAPGAGQDLGFVSLFDDIRLTGTFTQYNTTWEILVDDSTSHEVQLNKSGLSYENYLSLDDAWSSSAANPEGAVRVVSSYSYTYMVPLPLFKDHPMYDGLPDPGDPQSSYPGADHPGQLWCGDQQGILDAWLAAN